MQRSEKDHEGKKKIKITEIYEKRTYDNNSMTTETKKKLNLYLIVNIINEKIITMYSGLSKVERTELLSEACRRLVCSTFDFELPSELKFKRTCCFDLNHGENFKEPSIYICLETTVL